MPERNQGSDRFGYDEVIEYIERHASADTVYFQLKLLRALKEQYGEDIYYVAIDGEVWILRADHRYIAKIVVATGLFEACSGGDSSDTV